MKPIKKHCVKFNKFRKFVNPKYSYIFYKILVLPIISSKCSDNNVRIFKEKETTEIEISKILGLIK